MLSRPIHHPSAQDKGALSSTWIRKTRHSYNASLTREDLLSHYLLSVVLTYQTATAPAPARSLNKPSCGYFRRDLIKARLLRRSGHSGFCSSSGSCGHKDHLAGLISTACLPLSFLRPGARVHPGVDFIPTMPLLDEHIRRSQARKGYHSTIPIALSSHPPRIPLALAALDC